MSAWRAIASIISDLFTGRSFRGSDATLQHAFEPRGSDREIRGAFGRSARTG